MMNRNQENKKRPRGILKKWTGSILALLVAALLWFPCMHLFYKPDIEEYIGTDGVPPKARALAARHLEMWTDPDLRRAELRKMQACNPEWDFMSRTYFVLALTNMALRDPSYKTLSLEIVDAIADNTMKIEREKGAEHFLMGYASSKPWKTNPPRSMFVDGEIALMLAARRLVEERDDYRSPLSERIDRMVRRMKLSPVLCGESYPDECWIFCNTVALASIRLSDILDGTDHGEFINDWLRTAKQRLVDPRTGLLISAFDIDGTPLSVGFGPEGTSIWMAIHMLQTVDPEFARDQYRRARKELGRTMLGFGYSREWPVAVAGIPDIDSGPVIHTGA